MARNVTVSSLTTQIRNRTDQGTSNGGYVSDSEVLDYINASYTELYDLLVSRGEDYYLASTTFATDGTNDTYALPANFDKLRGVEVLLGQGNAQYALTIPRYEFAERNRFSYRAQGASLAGRAGFAYHPEGNSLRFRPLPAANQTVRVYYVPACPFLANPTDTVDGVDGWEEYIVVDCGAKVAAKEESFELAALFLQQKAALKQRIESMARDRDQGMPRTRPDTRGMDGWGWGRGGWGW